MPLSEPVLWFGAAMLCLGLEMLASVGVFIFFGLGCLAGWVAALQGAELSGQNFAAALACLLSLAALRKAFRRVFSGSDGPARASAFAGRRGEAAGALLPGEEGQVSLGGSYWRAVSQSRIEDGEQVVVEGEDPADPLLLRVRPAARP